MSPIPDDFEQLRRLLALKRYEQPPPGYFHRFSRDVIVRIKVGDLGNESEASFWSFGTGSVFQRIWATLDARPVMAGAFGVAVCGFFVVGALLSDNGAVAADNNNIPSREMVHASPVLNPNAETPVSSTMGVAMPSYQPQTSSLFDEIRSAQHLGVQQRARVESVNFRVPATAP